MTMDAGQSRALWHRLEPLNAVTYFCAETFDAFEALGFSGFWMGYFASRAAPMGKVAPETIDATFFNFHPGRVRRAIPEAWDYAEPAAVLETRAAAAAASLRRMLGAGVAEETAAAVVPVLRSAVEHGSPGGRPLFAANRAVEVGDDPVAALWQAATTLREHRGDGHVALLTSAGLSGVEALILFSLSEDIDPELFRSRRGWSGEEWEEAVDALTARGLVADGALSDRGREMRDEIERRTDELAADPYRHLSPAQLDALQSQLERAARVVVAADEIMFPNPMGLPKLGT
jgi:hypothetical protein